MPPAGLPCGVPRPTPLLARLIRRLPERLRYPAYYRLLHPLGPDDSALFESAPLAYAPGVQMRLLPGDVAHGPIAALGYYEPELSLRVADAARDGGLMVDVGANAGYFSLLWAAQSPRARVVAFEPAPRNVALLRENVDANGLADRVDVRALAAGEARGTLAFHLGPDAQTGWGSFSAYVGGRTLDVPVVRLDEAVDGPIRLLKVDAEGADAWVLRGAERLLRDRAIAEVHFEHLKSRARVLGIPDDAGRAFLESVGYRVEAAGPESAAVVDYTARPA